MTTPYPAIPTGSIALLVLTLVLPAPAHAADTPDVLARRLLRMPPDARVQLQRDDGDIAEGYLVTVDADSVRLANAPGGPATTAWPLDEVVRARREVAAAGHGFSGGASFGGVLGAIAGIGLVSLIDFGGDSNDAVTDADYAIGGIAFATAGAVAGGALGALVASGATTWAKLPPADGPARRHLEVQGGWATADDPWGVSYDGLRLQAWLPRQVSAAFSWGPEAGWSGLGGTRRHFDGGQSTIHDTWSAGGAARLALPGGGLRPFLKGGLGWYVREEAWLGISLGGGLLWRTADGGGLVAEVRWHGRSTGIDDRAGNGQDTATLGWSLPF